MFYGRTHYLILHISIVVVDLQLLYSSIFIWVTSCTLEKSDCLRKSNVQTQEAIATTTPWSQLIHFKCFHLKVIGAASKEKLDVIREMGASATIDYKNENIRDKVDTWIKNIDTKQRPVQGPYKTTNSECKIMLVINY